MKTQRIQVAIVTACGAEEEMFGYAKSLATPREAELHHIFVPSFAVPEDEEMAVAEVRQLVTSKKIDLIASEWLNNTRAMQDLIHLAQERGVTAVFVRTMDAPKVGRIVIATGGGPSLYEQMWLAREVAARNGAPVAILHWTGTVNGPTAEEIAENDRFERMCLRLLGMEVEFVQCSGPNFSDAVGGSLRPDDLLLIGATSPLRLVSDFAGSLPDQLARTVQNPLILLSSPPPGRIGLRRLLWGRMVKPRLRSHSNMGRALPSLPQEGARRSKEVVLSR
ncbi:hypothetical protein P4C99_03745 [Pontiellaceae bacterium B1224]|nr:hypothetical protein [Pontiellaceae bacterium B1224]